MAIAVVFLAKADGVGVDIESGLGLVFELASLSTEVVHQHPKLGFDEALPLCELFNVLPNDVDLHKVVELIKKLIVGKEIQPLILPLENILDHHIGRFQGILHDQKGLFGDLLGRISVWRRRNNDLHHLIRVLSILNISLPL